LALWYVRSMSWLLFFGGVGLVVVGLLDVFFTVLHYDDLGFLSKRLHKGIWEVLRRITAPMPPNLRNFGLSLGGPSMIPATILLWVGLAMVGFALIYYAGMGEENFAFDYEVDQSFGRMLYLSGVTVATLGYGDITPISPLYELVALSQALIGFGILSLSIAYVLGSYGFLHQLSILASDLYHQAEDPTDPKSTLVSHFPEGRPKNLDPHLMSLYRGVIAYAEGVRRYPVVYYFYGRRPYRSMPYAFYMIGGLAAALRWGLPKGHPASQEPWLPALIEAFTGVSIRMEKRFMPRSRTKEDPQEVDFATFVSCLEGKEGPADSWLGQFLDLQGWMRRLAGLEDALPDAEEAYARYKEWLPFAHRVDRFVRTALEDLGRSLDDIRHRDPKAKLFE
jgi:hypothetical protein